MSDPIFSDHRLAAIYDPLDPDRGDLDPYVDLIADLDATSVLDVGCGTGTLACELASRGLDVVAIDPAAASLAVAKAKPGADGVHWHHGTVGELPPMAADLAVMTGNVAQVFVTDESWTDVLTGVRSRLRPGGRLVFETRDPSAAAWRHWNRAESFRRVDLPDVGVVETWVDLIDVSLPQVSFRWTFVFARDGAVLTSDSTLRFRDEAEIGDALSSAGYVVDVVRDAPDRPDLELVFTARTTSSRRV